MKVIGPFKFVRAKFYCIWLICFLPIYIHNTQFDLVPQRARLAKLL